MRANSFFAHFLFGLFLIHGVAGAELKPGDRKFEAQLIWGTDKEKLNDPDLQPVDPDLVGRLQKVFKWKVYYRVKKVEFVVPAKGNKTVELSPKCEIDVTDKGKPMTEVKLFGEKKLVKTIKQAVTQCLVIAGDDRNDTAWFVVLTPK